VSRIADTVFAAPCTDTMKAPSFRQANGKLRTAEIVERLGNRFKLRSMQNALGWAVQARHIARVQPGSFARVETT
jgi:hypothetical protein